MADAANIGPASPIYLTLAAAVSPGELRQLADGRAGWFDNLGGAAAGDRKPFKTEGQVTIPKTAGICFLDGGKVFWDRSARAGHFKQVDDQDFFAGTCIGNAGSADATMSLNLNVEPKYKNDLIRDAFTPTLIGTPAESIMLRRRGGSQLFVLDATNEGQKADALAVEGFAIGANAIVEAQVRVLADDSGTAAVFSIGIASATHATAFTSITKALGIQVKAADGKIYVASNVFAATDTTKTYAVGTRFEIWIDTRLPGTCFIYVNGVQVLASTVFDLSAATTMYLLAHLVKTAAADTMQVAVDALRERTAEQ